MGDTMHSEDQQSTSIAGLIIALGCSAYNIPGGKWHSLSGRDLHFGLWVETLMRNLLYSGVPTAGLIGRF